MANPQSDLLDLPVHKHQVAGHLPLLYDNNSHTVCKPAHDGEVDFYANVATKMPQLSSFLPKVYGVVDCKGLVDLSEYAHQNDRSHPLTTVEEQVGISPMKVNPSEPSARAWGERVNDLKRSKLENNPNLKFICMEDLTCSYRRPCILDLKLGTQQHNPREPEEKIRSKQRKCATSTSSTLGLRLSGSQIFRMNEKDETYLCRDKYYGRRLNDEQLYDSLVEFFDNGDVNRVHEVVPQFLERVKKLVEVVKRPHVYRFYSSSLLFIYEGAVSHSSTSRSVEEEHVPVSDTSVNADSQCTVDMRLIDFASVDILEDDSGVDNGMLFGLENLIRLFNNLLSEP